MDKKGLYVYGKIVNRTRRKIPKINKHFKWKMNAHEINGIRVSYNDKFIQKLMNKDIREKKEIS